LNIAPYRYFFMLLISIKPTLTLQPNWSEIFRGETVTLRCEIQGGGGAQWTYEWRPTRNSPSSSEYRITPADSSRYSCRGTGNYLLTQWSDYLSLTVCNRVGNKGSQMIHSYYGLCDAWQSVHPNCREYTFFSNVHHSSGLFLCQLVFMFTFTSTADKPRATLTPVRTVLPAGGSVALICSVSRSVGWKFNWFRQESVSSPAQLIRTNEPDGVLRVSEGGVYSCRGGRGDPAFYTETSTEVNPDPLWSNSDKAHFFS
uniref:Ig-like domain-containing protein n=1 Tax=Fundulus heteroclitus TaxID=8078 RepID=A0A3Q2TWE0_FUNHE